MHSKISRRGFLQGSAILLEPIFSKAKERKTKSFALGFGSYGLPGYSAADAIRLVAQTGFDSIELAAMPGYHGSPEMLEKPKRKELRELMENQGIRLGALMGFPSPNLAKMKEGGERMEKLLELALELSENKEPPLLQSVLGGGKWDEKKTVFRDTLGPFVELASKAGIELSIKPHRSHAMSRPEQAIWLIDQLNAKGKLSLTFDYSHYAFRQMDPEETVAKALPYTGYVVLKDAVSENNRVSFRLPGTVKDFPHVRVLKALSNGEYRGEICCEVSSMVWRAKGYDSKTATKTCLRNMKLMLAEAEIQRSR